MLTARFGVSLSDNGGHLCSHQLINDIAAESEPFRNKVKTNQTFLQSKSPFHFRGYKEAKPPKSQASGSTSDLESLSFSELVTFRKTRAQQHESQHLEDIFHFKKEEQKLSKERASLSQENEVPENFCSTLAEFSSSYSNYSSESEDESFTFKRA